LLAAVQMLVHVGHGAMATTIHNAWLKTIEDGIHTVDIYDPATSSEKVGTGSFAAAVIARLGEQPNTLLAVRYQSATSPIQVAVAPHTAAIKVQVGIDVFVEWTKQPDELIEMLKEQNTSVLELAMVSNRGQLCFPGGDDAPVITDHYRCRFQSPNDGQQVSTEAVLELLGGLLGAGLPFIQTEGLFSFDGVAGYSLGQGQ
jgi:isocitrate dehydrogenase